MIFILMWVADIKDGLGNTQMLSIQKQRSRKINYLV